MDELGGGGAEGCARPHSNRNTLEINTSADYYEPPRPSANNLQRVPQNSQHICPGVALGAYLI